MPNRQFLPTAIKARKNLPGNFALGLPHCRRFPFRKSLDVGRFASSPTNNALPLSRPYRQLFRIENHKYAWQINTEPKYPSTIPKSKGMPSGGYRSSSLITPVTIKTWNFWSWCRIFWASTVRHWSGSAPLVPNDLGSAFWSRRAG